MRDWLNRHSRQFPDSRFVAVVLYRTHRRRRAWIQLDPARKRLPNRHLQRRAQNHLLHPHPRCLHRLSPRRSHQPLQPNRRRRVPRRSYRLRLPHGGHVPVSPPPLHLRLLLDPRIDFC